MQSSHSPDRFLSLAFTICWLITVLGFLIYFFSGVRWALHAMLAAALVGVVVGAIRFFSSATEKRS